MALSLRKLTKSTEKKVISVRHNEEGVIVHIFQIRDEEQLLKITNNGRLPMKFKWTWTPESAVFATLTDKGLVQIWDLRVGRPLITIETKIPNCLWANFVSAAAASPPPNDCQFLCVKNKQDPLAYQKLHSPPTSEMTTIKYLYNEIGFCKPDIYERDTIMYANGSNGIVSIRFETGVVGDKERTCVSEILQMVDSKCGMIILLKVIGNWLMLVYESGMIFLHDFNRDTVLCSYDLQQHYKDEEGMPLTFEGSAETNQFVVAVSTSPPKLFLLSANRATNSSSNNEPTVDLTLTLTNTFKIDGCASLSMHPQHADLIAVSGITGRVDLYSFPNFEHVLNIPHREIVIRNLLLVSKPAAADEDGERNSGNPKLFLLCASDTVLEYWNLTLMMHEGTSSN